MITSIILFLYVFILPGYLFSKLLFKNLKAYEIFGITLALPIFLLPWITFSLAWVLNTVPTLPLVIILTSVINIILGYLVFKQKDLFKFKLFSKKQCLFFLFCLLIFFVHFFNFEGPSKDYWSTYIVAGSMFISNDKIDFIDINGEKVYDYSLKGEIPENLIDKNSYNIVTKDQRIGAPIVYSLPYLIFGLAAFRIFHAFFIVLAFLFLYSIINYVFKSGFFALLGSLIVVLNPLLLYFNRLNANVVSLALISLLLFIFIRTNLFFLAGGLYGILGGIRDEAIIFMPALFIFILLNAKENKTRLRDVCYFILGSFLFILPLLMWKIFAYGSIFTHSTQYIGLQGYRPVFEHSIFGFKFNFNGLLNYPFHGQIVRTPHFPFPNFLTLPFLLLRSFGLFLFSAAVIGFYYLVKQKRNIGVLMLLLFFPFLFFLLFQENWEELKSSFLIILLPSLTFFVIAGVISIKNSLNRDKPLIAFITLVIIFFISMSILRNVDFEKDSRWYIRFPHSQTHETDLEDLPEDLRLDWQFFYTDETQKEYQYLKQKYTSVNILPQFYQPIKINNFSLEKFSDEFSNKQLVTLEVWDYIYS